MFPSLKVVVPFMFNPPPYIVPLELMFPLAVMCVTLGDASRLTVTVSVAPTAVVMFVPPAMLIVATVAAPVGVFVCDTF